MTPAVVGAYVFVKGGRVFFASADRSPFHGIQVVGTQLTMLALHHDVASFYRSSSYSR